MSRAELTPRQQNILDFVQEFQEKHGFPPSIREIGEFFGIRSTNGVSDHLRALEKKGFLTRSGHLSRCLQIVRAESDGQSARPAAGAPRSRAAAAALASKPALRSKPPRALALVTGQGVSHVAGNGMPRQPTRRVADHPDDGSSPDLRARLAGKTRARALAAAEQVLRVPILGRVAAGQPLLAVEEAEDTVVVDSFFLGGRAGSSRGPSGQGDQGEVFGLRVVGESMIEAGILPGDFLFVRKRHAARAGEIVVAMIDGEATVKRYFPEGDVIRFQPENRHMQPIFVRRSDFLQCDLLGTVVGIYRKL